jgi:ABC-type branched-subunit amino acid transport system permease subunit
MLLFIEQLLNGLQLGIMLFLMSAGLTLVFGIMQVINLAHGSFYMIGAYVGATNRPDRIIHPGHPDGTACGCTGRHGSGSLGAAAPLQKRTLGSGPGHIRPDHVFQ